MPKSELLDYPPFKLNYVSFERQPLEAIKTLMSRNSFDC